MPLFSTVLHRWTARFAAGLLAIGASLGAASAATVLPGPVVDVAWLKAHAKEVQIVDIRDDMRSLTNDPKWETHGGQKVLVETGGHIPDALSVNFWGLRAKHKIGGKTIDFLLPTAEEFQESMRAVQLQPNKPIVLTPTGDDPTSLQEAAFLAWELQLFGVPAEQIAILNGGVHAWIAAGNDVDTDAIAPMSSSKWTAKPPRADLLATTEQVQKLVQQPRPPLVDARPLAQFAGLDHTPVLPLSGRLPGAYPLPSEMLYKQAADGSWRFLSPEGYRALFALRGLPQPQPNAVIYCNTGQYAAGAWFVLDRILGVKGLREYPGGLNEWVQRGLPIVGL